MPAAAVFSQVPVTLRHSCARARSICQAGFRSGSTRPRCIQRHRFSSDSAIALCSTPTVSLRLEIAPENCLALSGCKRCWLRQLTSTRRQNWLNDSARKMTSQSWPSLASRWRKRETGRLQTDCPARNLALRVLHILYGNNLPLPIALQPGVGPDQRAPILLAVLWRAQRSLLAVDHGHVRSIEPDARAHQLAVARFL